MGEQSKIAWTDSTFNPWLGCQKVGPGCDNCYAELLDRNRFSKTLGAATKDHPIIHWGPGAPRHRTSESNWQQPLRWDRQQGKMLSEAIGGEAPPPPPWRVFCASLADVFDNEVPQAWRDDLFKMIGKTPNLSWLLVTKRIGNVAKMVPPRWTEFGFPEQVRLMVTVVNQEEADRDITKLLALPCKNGVSYEPALGPVDWSAWLPGEFLGSTYTPVDGIERYDLSGQPVRGLEWVIVGGESGSKARSFNVEWARSTVRQCRGAGVSPFVKQLGTHPVFEDDEQCGLVMRDRACADPTEWPEDLRVQEFPAQRVTAG